LTTVTYTYDFGYVSTGGRSFPLLRLVVRAANGQAVAVDAHLDSGASQSLFDGEILSGIGVNLLDGPLKRYGSAIGAEMEARIHRIRLEHSELGNFDLDVGFSVGPLSRNLLGRDFFDFVQLGFRENQQSVFIEPTP